MRVNLGRAMSFAAVAACAAAVAVGVTSASTAGASCHGERATFVGTNGDDRLDSSTNFGLNPVIVLGGGDDEIDLGSSDHRIRDLVICGGSGDDDVAIFESTGADSYLIDGGPGSD